MIVTPAQVAAFRAALDGDDVAFDRLSTDLGAADVEGFRTLMAAALVTAAQRRFPPGWSIGDVVQFVGQIRARDGAAHQDVSATAAEQMLQSVLRGQPMGGDFDANTKGYAQVALLAELLRDFSGQELNRFLSQACEKADAWLGHQSPR